MVRRNFIKTFFFLFFVSFFQIYGKVKTKFKGYAKLKKLTVEQIYKKHNWGG